MILCRKQANSIDYLPLMRIRGRIMNRTYERSAVSRQRDVQQKGSSSTLQSFGKNIAAPELSRPKRRTLQML